MFSSDVVWTAEFANQKWLLRHDAVHRGRARTSSSRRRSRPSPTTASTGASPDTSDAAFLYYRTDKVKEVPATWQEVYDDAAKKDGIVYQGAAYEGLTCAFLEIAFAAGGKVLSDDGKKAEFDSPENVKALQFMVDGIKNGAAPKAVHDVHGGGGATRLRGRERDLMRNWPYAYAVGKKNKNAPKFAVAPFPSSRAAARPASSAGTTT